MATKKTATQKITEKLLALALVSSKRAEIEDVLKLTDNDTVRAFISDTKTRYDGDIQYLRGQIMYQAKTVAETMNVDQFDAFAKGLSKLLS